MFVRGVVTAVAIFKLETEHSIAVAVYFYIILT